MPFVVGSPRSGTTLLRFMLDSHPDLAIPPETWFLPLAEQLEGQGDALRERFFQAGLKAALRLERQEFREWLMRRLSEPPLAAPVDPARFAISKADIALLMKSAGEAPLE